MGFLHGLESGARSGHIEIPRKRLRVLQNQEDAGVPVVAGSVSAVELDLGGTQLKKPHYQGVRGQVQAQASVASKRAWWKHLDCQ